MDKVGIAAVAAVALIGAFAGGWASNEFREHGLAAKAARAASAAEAEAASPRGQHRAKLAQHLNDPESAQFKDDRPSKEDPTIWCGLLNARNGMGGRTGYTPYVFEMKSDIFHTLPNRVDSDNREQAQAFLWRWDRFCKSTMPAEKQ